MKVLQINIRLTEGGAARVARELHTGLLSEGISSYYAYGYGRGGKPSPDQGAIGNCFAISSRYQAAANLAIHRLIGVDLLPPHGAGASNLKAHLAVCDIVHLHAIHSHFAPYSWLFGLIKAAGKPIVWTAHDHWMLTGRCAFTEECIGWQVGCGSCATLLNYPSSRLDISRSELIRKRKSIESLLNELVIVSPSRHLAKDILLGFPGIKLEIVPNSIDLDFEKLLGTRRASDLKELPISPKPSILVIANDLSYNGKTSHSIVRDISENVSCRIITVGKNSPFEGRNILNLGEINSRETLLNIMTECSALLFTSTVDNFPLVLCEAQSAGLPVLATKSAAAEEVLGFCGGNCLSIDEIKAAISNRLFFAHYSSGVVDSKQLGNVARAKFGSAAMLRGYKAIYEKALRGAALHAEVI